MEIPKKTRSGFMWQLQCAVLGTASAYVAFNFEIFGWRVFFGIMAAISAFILIFWCYEVWSFNKRIGQLKDDIDFAHHEIAAFQNANPRATVIDIYDGLIFPTYKRLLGSIQKKDKDYTSFFVVDAFSENPEYRHRYAVDRIQEKLKEFRKQHKIHEEIRS